MPQPHCSLLLQIKVRKVKPVTIISDSNTVTSLAPPEICVLKSQNNLYSLNLGFTKLHKYFGIFFFPENIYVHILKIMLQTCTQIFREISCIDTLFPSTTLQSSNVRFGNLLITLVVQMHDILINVLLSISLNNKELFCLKCILMQALSNMLMWCLCREELDSFTPVFY